MKIRLFITVVLAITVMATLSYSQRRGMGLCYRNIQLQTPVVVEGKINKIEEFTYGQGRYGNGLHLFVQNNGQESEIHLGPQIWLNEQGLKFQKGDTVRIKAYQGTLTNGKAALFAAEVFGTPKNGSVLLRDANGFPQWRQSLRGGKGRRAGGRGWRNR